MPAAHQSAIAKDLRAIAALMMREMIATRRDPLRFVASLIRPLVWVLFIGVGLRSIGEEIDGTDAKQFAFAGILLLAILQPSLQRGLETLQDRRAGFLRGVVVTPVSDFALTMGTLLSAATTTAGYGALALCLAPFLSVKLTLVQAVELFGIGALLAYVLAAFGLAIATQVRGRSGVGAAINFLATPMYLLSGGLFPVRGFPGWAKVLVRLNPMSYAVDLCHHALRQSLLFSLLADIGILVGFGGLCTCVAAMSFRRRDFAKAPRKPMR
jgi:ABC-2 type transport system permease protein